MPRAMVCSSCLPVTFQQSHIVQGSTFTQLPAVTCVVNFNKFKVEPCRPASNKNNEAQLIL